MKCAMVQVWELGLWDILFSGRPTALAAAFWSAVLLGGGIHLFFQVRCASHRIRYLFALLIPAGMLLAEIGCLCGADGAVWWFSLLPFQLGTGIAELLRLWWNGAPHKPKPPLISSTIE